MRRLAMLPLMNSSVSRLTSPWATVAAAQIASELTEECDKLKARDRDFASLSG
jgi:hypothetical protein